MLIVFGGLPGTGKTTIARKLAGRLKATYLRIDTIEQTLRECATLPAGIVTEGYAVAYRVAEDNLYLGGTVIADSVNPLAVTRDAWLALAKPAAVPVLEVEVVCSHVMEHRRRIETRVTDIPGLTLPTWDAIQRRNYETWKRPHVVLDTASQTPEQSVELLLQVVAEAGRDSVGKLVVRGEGKVVRGQIRTISSTGRFRTLKPET